MTDQNQRVDDAMGAIELLVGEHSPPGGVLDRSLRCVQTEIKRLTVECASHKCSLEAIYDTPSGKLYAERARLRASLKKILEVEVSLERHSAVVQMKDIAAEALRMTPGEDGGR